MESRISPKAGAERRHKSSEWEEWSQGGQRDNVSRTQVGPLLLQHYLSKDGKPYILWSGLCLLWREEEKFSMNHSIASPRVKFRNPFLLSHTFSPTPHCLPHQDSPSSMKSTMNIPSRSTWKIQEPIPEKVPVGGCSFIYFHHLPLGIPLESQNHKFQIKPPESSLMFPGEGTHCLCLHSPTQTPHFILLDPS